MALISYSDFLKIEIRVGTIKSATKNTILNKPSIVMNIDFGQLIGIKTSSAHLLINYEPKYLVGKQILAVTNFSPKKIGDIISEVLVLGLPDYSKNPVLVSPDLKIADGLKLY